MDKFAREFSSKLGQLYRDVTKLEETALKEANFGLTMSEVHLIDFISHHENGITICEIASSMDVSRPTISTSVSKMVKKGYLVKEGLHKDARKLTVKLSTDGARVSYLHTKCQREVIKNLGQDFTNEERDILLRAIDKLNVYFSTKK
ncbi:MAG: MarR family transcriptional regulator [Clostridia bacterium]